MIILMSSAGNPTVSNTITIVTKPADGMPAAPIEAAVAVTLRKKIWFKTCARTKVENGYFDHGPDGD